MTHYTISKPIWNGGKRLVGLNVELLQDEWTTFEILYTDRDGKRIYPNHFIVRTSVAAACPRQYRGVWLAIVPLSQCKQVVPTGIQP